MSMTPVTPNLGQTIKSFWSRPEGKTGMIVLGAAGLGAAAFLIMGWAAVVPFLATMMADTVHLAMSCAILAGMFFVATNKQIRCIVRNAFQLACRWTTQMFVEIDPIGILRNNLLDMKKKKGEFDEQKANVAGAKQLLERSINKKKDIINAEHSAVQYIDQQLASLPVNSPKARQLILDKQLKASDAGMKMRAVENQQKLLDQTTKMYDMLQRYSELADFTIQNTENQVSTLDEERKSTLAAYGAVSAASRILKGNPEQLEMVNQAIEFLADDTAKKLGYMDDFASYSEKFLTDMDVEKGAAAQDAEKMFSSFEQKLIGAGNQTVPVINTVQDKSGVYVPANTSSSSSDYSQFLK